MRPFVALLVVLLLAAPLAAASKVCTPTAQNGVVGAGGCVWFGVPEPRDPSTQVRFEAEVWIGAPAWLGGPIYQQVGGSLP